MAASQPAEPLLEPLRPDHAVELWPHLQDERLYRFIPTEAPVDLPALRGRCERQSAGAPTGSGEVWLNWVMRDPRDGAVVGQLQLTANEAGEVWLGYLVWPACWGKGLGRWGVRTLVDLARSRWPMAALRASVDARNVASLRALFGAGFALLHTEASSLRDEPTLDWVLGREARRPVGCSPTAVAAVMVHVPDVAAALDWYQRAFPSARRAAVPGTDFTCLHLGGVQLELVPADARVSAGAAGSVVYWSIEDLRGALSRLAALGAPVYRGPMAIEAGLGMAQVRDPWGNCIGLRGPWEPA